MSGVRTLTITHAAIRRGRTCIVEPGVISVPIGATVGLVGLNGAGKSTLMMAIAGALTGTSVSVTLDAPSASVRAVGYVPQLPRFPEWLTVGETAQLYGSSVEAMEAAFPEFQLGQLRGHRMSALSGGQAQLCAVALTLLQRVPLVLLDEPLSALDMRRRRQVLERLRTRDHSQRDGVRVVSSQVAADLAEACDWLVVLREGRYLFQGPRESLPVNPGTLRDVNAPVDKKREFEEGILSLLAG